MKPLLRLIGWCMVWGFGMTSALRGANPFKDFRKRPPVMVRFEMVKMKLVSGAGPGTSNSVPTAAQVEGSARQDGGGGGAGPGRNFSPLQQGAIDGGFAVPLEKPVAAQNGPVGYARKRPFFRRFFNLFNPFAAKDLGVGGRTTMGYDAGFSRPLPRAFQDDRTHEASGSLFNYSK